MNPSHDSWKHVRFRHDRPDLKRGGPGMFLLTVFFCAAMGALAGLLILLYFAGKIGAPGVFVDEGRITTARIIAFLLIPAVIGAIAGGSFAVSGWRESRDVQRRDEKE